jgi:hypothetical protein
MPIAVGSALLGAYVAYELVLFAATPFLAGEGAFTATIVRRLGILNIFWLIGLIAVCEAFRLLNSGLRRQTAS